MRRLVPHLTVVLLRWGSPERLGTSRDALRKMGYVDLVGAVVGSCDVVLVLIREEVWIVKLRWDLRGSDYVLLRDVVLIVLVVWSVLKVVWLKRTHLVLNHDGIGSVRGGRSGAIDFVNEMLPGIPFHQLELSWLTLIQSNLRVPLGPTASVLRALSLTDEISGTRRNISSFLVGI